jgi:predicted dehydrogenase
MAGTIKIALIGAGMFGSDVHLRTYANLQRAGIGPQLGRIGLGDWGRDLAPIQFELVAIAARSEQSARRAAEQFKTWTGCAPKPHWGDQPWNNVLRESPQLDVVAVATPDHLHTPAILAALRAGVHVITEKPMCLDLAEADQIIDWARRQNLVLSVDMHKRYDPDHLRIFHDLKNRIGEPLYGVAYLEEPIELPTRRFKWAQQSDPFSYVGPHWVDLICHYYRAKPVSLTAVGQKKRLVRDGIDAFDAVQVRVDFENGLSMHFHNNWITPPDFEGPVNQGHEIVGSAGKIESDQQYRGLRWWTQAGGMQTANTHFTREIVGPDGVPSWIGYGIDSLTTALAAICRVKCFRTPLQDVAAIYPTADQARIVVAVIQAARLVRDLNFKYLQTGQGAPVSARFGLDGLTILDPTRVKEGPAAVLQRVYTNPI